MERADSTPALRSNSVSYKQGLISSLLGFWILDFWMSNQTLEITDNSSSYLSLSYCYGQPPGHIGQDNKQISNDFKSILSELREKNVTSIQCTGGSEFYKSFD